MEPSNRSRSKLSEWLYEKLFEYERAHKKRISVSEFARMLNIPQSVMSTYMNDTRTPDVDNADKLAARLGPEIYDIIGMSRRLPDDDRLRIIVERWAHAPETIKQRILDTIMEQDRTNHNAEAHS